VVPPAIEGTWLGKLQRWLRSALRWLWRELLELARAHPYAVVVAIYGFFRAMGVTVQTGQRGLLFSFGRARAVLEPGFRFLLPFLQTVRIVPTRSRTLDLADQKVATRDGLVYLVHASLVWRVVDVRRALIEIDDLLKGMGDALALSVFEVLSARERNQLRQGPDLDRELAQRMEQRLEPWGVVVERAGFQSIAPSLETLEIVQLWERVAERERVARAMAAAPLPSGAALGLVGTPRFVVRRQVRAAARARRARWQRLGQRLARAAGLGPNRAKREPLPGQPRSTRPLAEQARELQRRAKKPRPLPGQGGVMRAR
jgi:regulator of protease activity HflC (stomatin/prohibitin superfamily)